MSITSIRLADVIKPNIKEGTFLGKMIFSNEAIREKL